MIENGYVVFCFSETAAHCWAQSNRREEVQLSRKGFLFSAFVFHLCQPIRTKWYVYVPPASQHQGALNRPRRHLNLSSCTNPFVESRKIHLLLSIIGTKNHPHLNVLFVSWAFASSSSPKARRPTKQFSFSIKTSAPVGQKEWKKNEPKPTTVPGCVLFARRRMLGQAIFILIVILWK